MALVTQTEDMILGTARGALGKAGGPDFMGLAGIYQVQKYGGKEIRRKCNFYDFVITHTTEQNTNRDNFALAVSTWQALSLDDKMVYNKKAKRKAMSGFNLFIKYFLNS